MCSVLVKQNIITQLSWTGKDYVKQSLWSVQKLKTYDLYHLCTSCICMLYATVSDFCQKICRTFNVLFFHDMVLKISDLLIFIKCSVNSIFRIRLRAMHQQNKYVNTDRPTFINPIPWEEVIISNFLSRVQFFHAMDKLLVKGGVILCNLFSLCQLVS